MQFLSIFLLCSPPWATHPWRLGSHKQEKSECCWASESTDVHHNYWLQFLCQHQRGLITLPMDTLFISSRTFMFTSLWFFKKNSSYSLIFILKESILIICLLLLWSYGPVSPKHVKFFLPTKHISSSFLP